MSDGVGRRGQVDTDALLRAWANMPRALATMGWEDMRPGQRHVVSAIMSQTDTLCILPTAAGKTGGFVLPTLCYGWRNLVFSPLQALMRDQVQNLQLKGVQAEELSGMRGDHENAHALRRWINGELNMLYAAPERMSNPAFMEAMKLVRPDMVTVDEAHVVESWGTNFRACYSHIDDFIAMVGPRAVAAFTATCPPHVEKVVAAKLGLSNYKKVFFFPSRDNLLLESRSFTEIGAFEADMRSAYERMGGSGSGIIYVASIKTGEELCARLQGTFSERNVGLYHGELDKDVKRAQMDAFMSGRVRWMVATCAFGMGVDKPDVRVVFHFDYPGTLSDLSQEVGRAGRDGNPSLCRTYFREKTAQTRDYFIRLGCPSRDDITAVYRLLERVQAKSGGKAAHLSVKSIAEQTGLFGPIVEAIIETLNSYKVIMRENNERPEASVRILRHEAKYGLLFDAVRRAAAGQDKIGGHRVVVKDVAEDMRVKPDRVKDLLRAAEADGLVVYVRPPRNKACAVTGALEEVDFDELDRRRAHMQHELRSVVRYTNIPDEEKHPYLLNYLQTGRT